MIIKFSMYCIWYKNRAFQSIACPVRECTFMKFGPRHVIDPLYETHSSHTSSRCIITQLPTMSWEGGNGRWMKKELNRLHLPWGCENSLGMHSSLLRCVNKTTSGRKMNTLNQPRKNVQPHPWHFQFGPKKICDFWCSTAPPKACPPKSAPLQCTGHPHTNKILGIKRHL